MNIYLLALICVIAAFAVGFVVYGQLFKGPLGTANQKIDPQHLGMATVLIYLASLAFIYIFDRFTMSGMTGAGKGLTLGLIAGLGFFAFPLIADGSFFNAKKEAMMAVLLNWVGSFLLIGFLVGLLR